MERNDKGDLVWSDFETLANQAGQGFDALVQNRSFSIFGGSCFTGPIRRTSAFLGLFLGLSFYLGVLGRGDIRWLRNLIFGARKQPKTADATNS